MTARRVPDEDPYTGWRRPLPEPIVTPASCALLVIDMQYADASMDHGIFKLRRELGSTGGLDYFEQRLRLIVGNTHRLQRAFRERGMEVMFSRICSQTLDGRDRSPAHTELGLMVPPGSKEAQILEELAPSGDELVFDKTTGSVFNSTTIDYVLRNIRIRTLVMTGVMTSGCVESAARDARDLGYGVIVVEDACATWTHAMHEASIRVMNEVFAKIKTTDEVLRSLHRRGRGGTTGRSRILSRRSGPGDAVRPGGGRRAGDRPRRP